MNQPSRLPTSLPLSGITVVSLEQAIAAPLASRHLADWGAPHS
jgi:crotonobetainyl-CoA:carnitine CoA-transferase CaiB-like acyl-CoA transferase